MLRMGLRKLKIGSFWSVSIWVLLVLMVNFVQCQDFNDYDQVDNPAVLPFVTDLVNRRLSNLTNVLSKDISKEASFCIKNQEEEWNKAFNFSSNLDFLASCIQKTQGSIMRRVCTAAEAKFYFDTFFGSSNVNTLRPNRNCNLTSWVSGCEPGWACSVGPNEQVDLENSRVIPSRTIDCQACCEGFFCPRGLTCMIPCPLGSHCPIAKLNTQTGICEPYLYQLPQGRPNHTCGGANIWADVRSSSEVFCSAGSYCPTTVQKEPCDRGHYCRTGSTSEKRCFKLTSCNSSTSTQDMHAYGIMLIAATVTLLLIIYNCSDQVLTTRERRLAKAREAAARSARETAKARQRWKTAKNAAKKHASGLQTSISQKFSFKKPATDPEELKILDQTSFEMDEDLYAPSHMSTSSESQSSSAPSNVQPMEPVNEMRAMREIEYDPENYDGFDVGSHNRKSKGQTTKGKQPHTHSQIFKYAYSQLEKEKEKAQQQENKNLTFSGVISMATNPEIRKRPLIEISFKDLTLTLKGKGKHLLRCVTGKLKPGRITAVMGPSGAGKTTFISALGGKAMGCKKTGLILINGKNESIRSYRKIIGYVPQDDIVHGNLTVEENLWFSAKCRLPAHLPKPDKVLVVERVIESLGLQMVRDSLVGTVEKRGISGGQRKRVNVGLEMVMEPSLLILDEPTSGLDSASSNQLLRALRHEALEGVNICMVVHQPSYSLYQMFDDLVLLAKGGLTVYHGSAKKAEQYFAGLGIHVPDRVNPPDHFIDILEGIVKPKEGVNYKELPVRWMLHNGYPVPPDLQQSAARIGMPRASADPANDSSPRAGIDERTFAGELWQDVKSNAALYRDGIRHNFLKFQDLSSRRTPGVFWQYRYYLGRVGKQRLREAKIQATDYLILLLAGACLGTLAKTGEENFGAIGYTYTIIAVSLLCKIAALRSFSLDKLQYWRESASGMSSLAFFLAKDTIDHFNTVIKPVVYLSMFYFFTNPRSSFAENYIVLLCLVYCVTGIGYAFAIFFQPGPAQLWSVLLPVVLTLVATRTQDSEVLKKISNLCYPKWALEAFVIANAERYYGVWLITRCGALQKSGYNIHEWTLCLVILILTGAVSRLIAFLGMMAFQKK